MATRDHTAAYFFPRIQKVQLQAFSLYSLSPDVGVSFADGITCLAGANGIGKSTLLAAINFGLTGLVPLPSRKLLSIGNYVRDALAYTSEFFDGRIKESDREIAAIDLEFIIKQSTYNLRRPLFAPNELSELSVRKDGVPVKLDTTLSAVQRASEYQRLLCADIGMKSFEQFVFFQHFLLTFDEARHLLFWDEAAAQQMLFLCFGGDTTEAARADELNRDMEKQGSRGRNLQFQASNIAKQIELLQKSSGLTDPSDDIQRASEIYQEKVDEVTRLTEEVESSASKVAEADLKVAQANASVAALRISYADLFNLVIHGTTDAKDHPIIRELLQSAHCPICETQGRQTVEKVRSDLEKRRCPLCSSDFSKDGIDNSQERGQLAEIDGKLEKARSLLNEAIAAKARLSTALARQQDDLLAAKGALARFEDENEALLDQLRARRAVASTPLQQKLEALEQAYEQIRSQRDDAYKQRDQHKRVLQKLQRTLQLRYIRAEQEFVPLFRELAELFLGIDLDVSLVTQGTTMRLQIEMRGSARRQEHQLSESQRFFVDIALRMAIAKFSSRAESRASMFIDTPEGSLDIAYEERAGKMFADFSMAGHSIIMTANINTSKLLTEMATICTQGHMKLVRMTSWSELSDVQQKAQKLFNEAYDEIESAMTGGHAANAQP